MDDLSGGGDSEKVSLPLEGTSPGGDTGGDKLGSSDGGSGQPLEGSTESSDGKLTDSALSDNEASNGSSGAANQSPESYSSLSSGDANLAGGIQSNTGLSDNTVEDSVLPPAGADSLSNTVEPVGGSVGGTAEPILQSTEELAAGTTAPLTTEPVADGPIREVVEPLAEVAEPLDEVTEPAIEVASPLANTLNEVTNSSVALIQEALAPSAGQVGKAVEPLAEAAEPVLSPVGSAVEPVTDAAEPVVKTFSSIVSPVADTVNPLVAPVGGVVAPVMKVVNTVVAPVTKAAEPVLDPIGQIISPVIEAAEPVVGPIGDVLSPVVDPVVTGPIEEILAPVVTMPTDEPMAPVSEPSVSEPIFGKVMPEVATPVLTLPLNKVPALVEPVVRTAVVESVGETATPSLSLSGSPLEQSATETSLVLRTDQPSLSSSEEGLASRMSVTALALEEVSSSSALVDPGSVSFSQARLLDSYLGWLGHHLLLGEYPTPGSVEKLSAPSERSWPSPAGHPLAWGSAGSSSSGSSSGGGFLTILALLWVSVFLLASKHLWALDDFLIPPSALRSAIERPG